VFGIDRAQLHNKLARKQAGKRIQERAKERKQEGKIENIARHLILIFVRLSFAFV
jgi:hypothetical protein